MILILSQSEIEGTTELVMDWLRHEGAPCLRLNGDDVDGPGALTLTLTDDGVRLALGDEPLPLRPEAVRAVWFRRWQPRRRHASMPLFDEAAVPGAAVRLSQQITTQLDGEVNRLGGLLFSAFNHAGWLSHPSTVCVNKLYVLATAARLGLATPATLITTERAQAARFAREHGALITKPISEAEIFPCEDRTYMMYTAALTPADVAALPARFFPSLFQERLAKSYEVRTFYLDGQVYSMAIFSQRDRQTQVDFRHYNLERPNRFVPYRLPDDVSEAVVRLMETLGLDTGSLDLIRTPDGRHVFLEVNPVGQFGMVSGPCNYHLERRVAALLIEKARHAAA